MRTSKKKPTQSKEVVDDIVPFAPILNQLVEEKGLTAKSKSMALKTWWKEAGMPHKTNALVEGDYVSCETHTGITRKNSRYLNLEILEGKMPFNVPDEHLDIFAQFHEQIQKSHLIVFSKAIRFMTLRQNGDQFFLFIQCSPARQQLAKQIKKFAEWLERHLPEIRGAYALYSGQDRRFNLHAPQRDLPIEFKKLYGPDSMVLKVGEKKYFYHPLEYYRPNQGVLPELVDSVAKQLVLKKDETFVDLYAGGGFFSELLAHKVKLCIAIDIRKISKASSNLNAGRNDRKNVKFLEMDIHSKNFAETLPSKIQGPAKFLLNPPQGVLPAPIMNTIALQSPERIVRIYQNPEDLQKEIRKWKRLGYILQKCIPLDSYHFNSKMELLVTLSPDRNEVLKKKPAAQQEKPKKKEQVILFKQ